MGSIYGTSEFLMTEVVLAEVYKLMAESEIAVLDCVDEIDACDKEDKDKIQQLGLDGIRTAAIYNLCKFFLKSKDSYTVQEAIKKLHKLSDQEKKLAHEQEFEAAAKIRDEKQDIRDYLAKTNNNESEITEGCLVNILQSEALNRKPI